MQIIMILSFLAIPAMVIGIVVLFLKRRKTASVQ